MFVNRWMKLLKHRPANNVEDDSSITLEDAKASRSNSVDSERLKDEKTAMHRAIRVFKGNTKVAKMLQDLGFEKSASNSNRNLRGPVDSDKN
ncbi:hypothetical protein TSAR_004385 [Trichomalopsis sarcophagae]|uniref:Uncharacterized protein n=1 Tax=Trichomalopsis sarcophagae TaxID=543379 RepID=A0A232FGV6_9HYME|nr:hypothetical protein TSAR_004385 [Trichomalopsis sarcophagae]